MKITGKRSALRRVSGMVVFVCMAGLAYTGFYAMPRQVVTPGYARMTHVTFGGVFSAALMVWALLTAQIHHLSGVNLPWLKSSCEPDYTTYPGTAQKCCYWIMLVSALGVMGAAAFNMYAWFTMDQQTRVVTVHVWSAVVLASSAALYCLLILGQCLFRRDQ